MSPYQYGANNPILNVDINGDSVWVTTSRPVVDSDGNTTVNHTIHISGKVLKQGTSGSASDIAKALNSRLNNQSASSTSTDSFGRTQTVNVSISGEFSAASSMDDVSKSDHLVVLVDNVEGKADPNLGGGDASGLGATPGKIAYIESSRGADGAFHEIGHNLGLHHPDADSPENNPSNPMAYNRNLQASFNPHQMTTIYSNSRSNIQGISPNSGANSALMREYFPGVSQGAYSPSTNTRPFQIAPAQRDLIPLPLINRQR